MSFASFVSSLPVVGASAPVAPAGFVPASLRVGGAVVSSSRFLPVCSGVSVVGLSWDSVRGAVVLSLSSGVSLRCLASGLGGAGSPDAVALVAALRAARRSGATVRVFGAPGRGGRVCPGYFCGFEVL